MGFPRYSIDVRFQALRVVLGPIECGAFDVALRHSGRISWTGADCMDQRLACGCTHRFRVHSGRPAPAATRLRAWGPAENREGPRRGAFGHTARTNNRRADRATAGK